MSVTVTLPIGIGLQDWASQYNRASNLIEDFPDPYSYAVEDWREWAQRFVQTTL